MLPTPSPDGMGGFLFFYLGAYVALSWTVSAIVVEALLLLIFLRNGVWMAAIESIVINIVSTLAGAFIGYVIATIWPGLATRSDMTVLKKGLRIYMPLAVIALFILSVWIEGRMLIRMEKETSQSEIWETAIAINIVSYGLGYAVVSQLIAHISS
jgi:hypothetical protein